MKTLISAIALLSLTTAVEARGIAIRVEQGIGYGVPQSPSAAPWYGPRTGVMIAPTARVRRLPGGIEAPANGCSRPAFEAVSGPDKGTCYAN